MAAQARPLLAACSVLPRPRHLCCLPPATPNAELSALLYRTSCHLGPYLESGSAHSRWRWTNLLSDDQLLGEAEDKAQGIIGLGPEGSVELGEDEFVDRPTLLEALTASKDLARTSPSLIQKGREEKQDKDTRKRRDKPSNRITTFNARRAGSSAATNGHRTTPSSRPSRRQQQQRAPAQAPEGAPTAPRAHLAAERQQQQGPQEQQQQRQLAQAPPQHRQGPAQRPRRPDQPTAPSQPTAPRQQQRPVQPSQQAHNGHQQQQRRRVSPPAGLPCPRAAFTPGFRGLSQEAIDRYKYTSKQSVELFPLLSLGDSSSLIFIRDGEGISAEQQESSNVRGAATGPTFCSGPTTDSTDSDGSSQGSSSSAPATTPPGTTPSPPPPPSLSNHGVTDRVDDGSPRIPVIRIVDSDDQAAAVEGPFDQAPTHPAISGMPAWIVHHWLPSWPRSKLYMESEPYNPKTDATKYRAPIGRREPSTVVFVPLFVHGPSEPSEDQNGEDQANLVEQSEEAEGRNEARIQNLREEFSSNQNGRLPDSD